MENKKYFCYTIVAGNPVFFETEEHFNKFNDAWKKTATNKIDWDDIQGGGTITLSRENWFTMTPERRAEVMKEIESKKESNANS